MSATRRVLLNWAIVSAPRHPVISRTIENVVDVIRMEYLGEPVLRNLNAAYRCPPRLFRRPCCAYGRRCSSGGLRSCAQPGLQS